MNNHHPDFPYEVIYVVSDSELATCVQQLYLQTEISVDLEFDKDRVHYGFTLSLLQIAASNTIYVIDALKGMDLAPLFKVFETSSILKVMHCPGEDLRLLHHLSCYPTPLLDTEIAAKLLNYEMTSLAVMLSLKLGVQLDKSLQKSDWTKRPISPAQLDYAAQDVVYLATLKTCLLEEAASKNCLSYIVQENKYLSQIRYKIDKRDNFLKKEDFLNFNSQERYLLNELLIYRDQLAEQLNLPAYRTIDDTFIRAIVKKEVDLKNWGQLKGLHPKLRDQKSKIDFGNRMAQIQQQLEKTIAIQQNEPSITNNKKNKPNENHTREHKDFWKQKLFDPIQQSLANEFGNFAFRYILSSSLVNDLIQHKTSIRQIQPTYKQDLIIATAQQLNLDLKGFL